MFVDSEDVHGMGSGLPASRSRKPPLLGLGVERNEAGNLLVAGFLSGSAVVMRRARASRACRMARGHGYQLASAGRMFLFMVEKQLVTHRRTLFQKVERREMADFIAGKAPAPYSDQLA